MNTTGGDPSLLDSRRISGEGDIVSFFCLQQHLVKTTLQIRVMDK